MPGMSSTTFRKPNKYGAFRIDTPEGRFDSQKEFRRSCELKLLQRAGEIRDLKRQVDFVLVPEQREPPQTQKNGREKPGKLLERQMFDRHLVSVLASSARRSVVAIFVDISFHFIPP